MFEKLETRVMFATLGTWSPLNLAGTSGADVITLWQSGDTLSVRTNGVTQAYDTEWVSGIGTTPGSEITSGISKVVIHGLAGNDSIRADSTVQELLEIYGDAGIDNLRGGSRNDRLYGGSNLANGISEMSADVLDGLGGNDNLFAAAFSPATMYGGAGNDVLTGGAGNDYGYGGTGNDWVIGQGGNDFVQGETGTDQVWGGGGVDTITYQYVTAASGVSVRLDDVANDGTAGENDNVHSDVERVWGSKGNDVIVGSAGNNLLAGDTGNDQIHGAAGNDSVYGDAGNDKVWGDAGDDVVSGGDGNDAVYGGDGTDWMYGDAGTDTLVSLGGGSDHLNGGAGLLDSFWADPIPTDTIYDASAYETSHDAVHRVGSFASFKHKTAGGSVFTYTPTKNLYGQDIPDPVKTNETLTGFADFSDCPLFNNGYASTDDIDQAGGGSDPADCWYMAPLSAAAMKNANFIRQRIVELGDGTYAMRFWQNGVERFMRMDADLPANGSGNPLYAGYGGGNSIWVAMMEKGLAMFRNVRPPNDGGTPNDASDDFAGDVDYAHYDRVAYGNESEAWRFLGGNATDPQVRNPSNLAGGTARAQWALDGLSAGRAVTIAYKGHVRSVEGGVYMNGVLTGLRLRDPYGQRYNISTADIVAKEAWITSAVV